MKISEIPAHKMREIAGLWRYRRQKCRTDIVYLCNKILNYPDVCHEVHGQLIENLQKFPGRDEHVNPRDMRLLKSKPRVALQDLKGPRQRMFLFPREHLKTSLVTIAHTIQWIINYEDVRVLISTAVTGQAEDVVTAILNHFRYNNQFRDLFPEFCPDATKAGDFGSRQGFTVPNRRSKWLREQTVMTVSVGKTFAGTHHEVIKHSDIVDWNNVQTPGQIESVKDHIRYTRPLTQHFDKAPYHGWFDIEGTIYDFSDVYSNLIEQEEALPKHERQWSIVKQSAELDPEKEKTLWESRYPWEELKKMEREMGPVAYSSQMLLNPIPEGGGLATLDQVKFFPYDIAKQLIPHYRIHCTIDLAGMEEDSVGDFTVITVAGFQRDGTMDVLEIHRGHYTPHQVIEMLFLVKVRYPQIKDFKIEKDAHARTLLPFLKREMARRRLYLTVITLQRDTRTSKKQRIQGLQAWFAANIIRFSDGITCRTALVNEIVRFPKYRNDDILDTIADQMQNRDHGVIADVMPKQKYYDDTPQWMRKNFMGFDPWSHDEVWADERPADNPYYHPVTGI